MFNMMQQIQKIQQQAAKLQAELDEMTFTGASGGGLVEADVSGQTRFKAIRLKPEALNPENPESVSQETLKLLEDLILAAITEANRNAAIVAKEKMEAVTSGLNAAAMGGFPPKPPKAPEGIEPKAKDKDDDGFGGIGGFGNLLG